MVFLIALTFLHARVSNLSEAGSLAHGRVRYVISQTMCNKKTIRLVVQVRYVLAARGADSSITNMILSS